MGLTWKGKKETKTRIFRVRKFVFQHICSVPLSQRFVSRQDIFIYDGSQRIRLPEVALAEFSSGLGRGKTDFFL